MAPKRLYAIAAMLALAAGVQWLLRIAWSDDEGRVGVSGRVTTRGTPLESGRIHFRPDPGTQGPDAWGAIEGGWYSIRSAAGPVPGAYRVSIEVGSPPSKKGLMEAYRKGQRPVGNRTVSWPEPVVIGTDRSRRQFNFDLTL